MLGDTIKAGRRGSLNGTLIVTGRQGHVAYPDRADNPIRGLMTLIAALQAPLDEGSEQFDPSHLEFTSVDVGNPTVNLIPGEARARFNIRYNDHHSQTALKALIERRAQTAAAGRVHYSFDWQPSNAEVFVTKPGPFTDLAAAAIAEVTGPQAEALDHRRHLGRALHQGLLPGARIRPGRPDHAPGRRMRPGCRPRRADVDLPSHYRALFRLIVLHPHQIKPLRRGDLAAARAVAGGECGGEILGAPFALADMHQRADHRAHLMVQERARRGGDVHLVAVALNVEAIEALHRRFRLALGGAEGGEVVPADETLRGGVHRGAIERARHAPGAVLRRARDRRGG